MGNNLIFIHLQKKKYYQELTFTPQIIIEPKLEKKGFFKSLFSK